MFEINTILRITTVIKKKNKSETTRNKNYKSCRFLSFGFFLKKLLVVCCFKIVFETKTNQNQRKKSYPFTGWKFTLYSGSITSPACVYRIARSARFETNGPDMGSTRIFMACTRTWRSELWLLCNDNNNEQSNCKNNTATYTYRTEEWNTSQSKVGLITFCEIRRGLLNVWKKKKRTLFRIHGIEWIWNNKCRTFSKKKKTFRPVSSRLFELG